MELIMLFIKIQYLSENGLIWVGNLRFDILVRLNIPIIYYAKLKILFNYIYVCTRDTG
jgi:hypothetical protein